MNLFDLNSDDPVSDFKEKFLSGVVVRNDKGLVSKFERGELLQPQHAFFMTQEQVDGVLDVKEMYHKYLGKVKITVRSIDRKFKHGDLSFHLVFEADITKMKRKEYFVMKVPVPFQNLRMLSLQMKPDFLRYENNFGVVYAIDHPQMKTGLFSQGFHSVFFNMEEISERDLAKKEKYYF